MFTTIYASATSKKTNSSSSHSRPESCTSEQFAIDMCPCVFNDPRVVICENLGITRIPDTELKASAFKIFMPNNSIKSIEDVEWPRSLSTLVLVNNSITHIGPKAFDLAPSLKLLFLSHNQISYFDQDALVGLSELTWLQLENNRLDTFESSSLIHTPKIAKLYLSENMIDLPETTRFDRCCQNLRQLLLDYNRISFVYSHWFSNMTSLRWLSLSHNEITFIEDGSFDWNPSLTELNLSFNKIMVINSQMFARHLGITRLYLSYNPFRSLPRDAFRELLQLRSLNLTGVEFDQIDKETFAGLELSFIYFERFRYCHFASHATVCLPLTDGLSSTRELLVFPILKNAVIIVALVCCLGNVFVFIWRSVSPHEHYTLSLFVRNLSIADLMMGIYLAAIGYKDRKTLEAGEMLDWMSSTECTTIGFIAILSSELSVLILIIITIERYRSITTTKILEEEEQKRRARIYLLLAWIGSFMIASYPLLERLIARALSEDNDLDYYATNGLCLPLHIDQPYLPGWQYSAIVYLGINFLAVIIIIFLYVRMYARIMQARQQACPYAVTKREDAILATRFFFIVITDCVTWIPIVIIKIMAMANVSIPSSIYGWLVVFIIPINSALNPILYTLAAPTSMRSTICKWFKRTCDRLDQLTKRAANGSRYSSHSSSSSSAESGNMMGFRRKNTSSTNSTTIDTFESSIGPCNPKPSVESALIHYDSIPRSSIFHHEHQSVSNKSQTARALGGSPPILDLTVQSTRTDYSLEELDGHGQLEMSAAAPRRGDRRGQHESGIIVAFKSNETLDPSSLDLKCRKSTDNGTNKQQADPANSIAPNNKLDSLTKRRRRQFATTVATSIGTSFSSSGSASNSSGVSDTSNGIGSCTENKLSNSSQADYLSTYEDNTTDNSGAPLLADKMTAGRVNSSSIGTGVQCEDYPMDCTQQQRRLTRLENNSTTAAAKVHPHQHQHVLIQFKPDESNLASGGLMKALDPLQLRRSTMDSSSAMASITTNELKQNYLPPPIYLHQRRFTETMQVSAVGGGSNHDDDDIADTAVSLNKLISSSCDRAGKGPAGRQRLDMIDKSPGGTATNTSTRHSSRVSFDSKDSRTCLLSGADKY